MPIPLALCSLGRVKRTAGSNCDIVPSDALGAGSKNYGVTCVSGTLTIAADSAGTNPGLICGFITGALGQVLLSGMFVLWRGRRRNQQEMNG